MNEWGKQELGELDVIADAVRTYPLAPVPSGLAQAIMVQIRSTIPAPRFELKWLDVALGLFGASMTGLVWLLWQSLPGWPDLVTSLVFTALGPFNTVDIALGAIGVFGGLFALGLCFVIALVVLIPRPTIRYEPVAR